MLLGLDIGSTALRACAVSPSGSKGRLQLFDAEELPLGAVVNGVIKDSDAIISAMRALFSRSSIATPQVAVTLPHCATIVQTMHVGLRRGRYNLAAIRADIEARIPSTWSDFTLSVAPFHEDNPQDVLAVAAPNASIATLRHVIHQAGGSLHSIDAAAAVSFNLLMHAGHRQGRHAIVDVGLDESRIVLVEDGTIRATAIFPRGGLDLTESLQEALSISGREAELYKLGGVGPHEGVIPRDVHEQLHVVCQALSSAIYRSIQKAAQSAQMDQIQTIHCIGRGADLSLFYDTLAEISQAKVTFPSPLESLSCDPFEYTSAYLQAVRAASSFAFGAILPWTSVSHAAD